MRTKEQINQLTIRILELEIKVKQHECEHDFKFKKNFEQSIFGGADGYPECFGKVIYKCSECGKIKTKYWKYLTKKKQQALKTLNLVPEYWEVKKND